jgi:Zn finger protein HypA/HybF involved in hydrogenase expression
MDLECPYCEKELDINHDDGFGYEEGIKHQIECPHCEKSFVFQTSISFYYEPEKADCLNGNKHNYQLTHTAPKEFSKMRCSMCDDERELNKDERARYNIGTKENYFKSLKIQ